MNYDNAYFICPQHGKVYVMRHATLFSKMDFRELVPLIEGVKPPGPDDPVLCPLCGNGYRIFFGDR